MGNNIEELKRLKRELEEKAKKEFSLYNLAKDEEYHNLIALIELKIKELEV